MQLPLPLAHSLQAVAIIIREDLASGGLLAFQEWEKGLTIDGELRASHPAGFHQRGDDIEIGGEGRGLRPRLHDAWPADNEWDADAAFKGRALPFPEGTRRTRMSTKVQPWSVITGENDHRILLLFIIRKGL